MDVKKLSLSKTKCHIVHIGKEKVGECSKLKIQESEMKKETQVKYLGDQINESGSIKATIIERRARAYGITSEILSIANSVPLGPWRVRSGITLRQAMLVNGILYNSECWQGKDVDKGILTLAKPDQALLRGLISGHSKVKKKSYFLRMAVYLYT